jgi:hypothetical protein
MTAPIVRGQIQHIWPGAFDLMVLREAAAFNRAQSIVGMISEARRLQDTVRFGQEIERLCRQ